MENKVSVIVPIYKVEDYLDQCLESILSQTYQNLEIILVDDGSPDRCGEICDVWKERDQRVKVIHKENGGLSDARNAGMKIASGEFLLFVDSDDWVERNLVEKALTSLLREHADICSFGIYSCSMEKKEAWDLPAYCGPSEGALKLLYDDTLIPVASWNKLYRRSLWENVSFPVGKLYEDAFTTYLVLDKAERIVQMEEPLYCYRIREGSIMNSSFSIRYMDAEEAWRENYEFVAGKYPGLRKDAFDFYLQKVNWIYHAIPKNQRETYRRQYLLLKGILARNLLYILFASRLKMKNRIKIFLDFFWKA